VAILNYAITPVRRCYANTKKKQAIATIIKPENNVTIIHPGVLVASTVVLLVSLLHGLSSGR
jgi:hypothetical protein